MTDHPQAQWPPPPPPPPLTRPKPFFETTMGALVIVAIVVAGIFAFLFITYNLGDDDSATVVCEGDASSTTCTRY